MIKNKLLLLKTKGSFILFLLIFSFSIKNISAQCSAGMNESIVICNKSDITNPTNARIGLFGRLGGSPTAGGTWSTSDNNARNALNTSTGVIDIFQIRLYGTYNFTYTVNCSGTPNTATVTVLLGGYPGEDNTSASVCETDSMVNLFQFVASSVPNKEPDYNATWSIDSNAPAVNRAPASSLNDNIFDASQVTPGIYRFICSTPRVIMGSSLCIGRTAQLTLKVFRAPNSGTGSQDITFCINEDFTNRTSYNLGSTLSGSPDTTGSWTAISGGGPAPSDNGLNSTINLQDLSRLGVGTYRYAYRVLAENPTICAPSTTNVGIRIIHALSGTLSIPNYCQGDNLNATLRYTQNFLPDGMYVLEYTVTSGSNAPTSHRQTLNFTGGSINFTIPQSAVTVNQKTTVSITRIRANAASGSSATPLCTNTPRVSPREFIVSNATVSSANPICVNEEATVNLSRILENIDGDFISGSHRVNYTLSRPNGTSVNLTNNVSFTNGNGELNIPGANFTDNENYTVEITAISGALDIPCEKRATIVINPPLNLSININDTCNATDIRIRTSAPMLGTGQYTVSYRVRSVGTTTNLIANSVSNSGGNFEYRVDVSSLAQGNYTIVTETNNSCSANPASTQTRNFSIGGTADPPSFSAPTQNFCSSNFGSNGPTIADIRVTALAPVNWFSNTSSTTPLPSDTPLVNGEDYFVAYQNSASGCFSSNRVGVRVNIQTLGSIVVSDTNPAFCVSQNATITDLNTHVTASSGTLVWYSAATGGNPLDVSTALSSGTNYFVASRVANSCESNRRERITPTILGIETPQLSSLRLSICRIENPRVEELDKLVDTNVSVRWFDAMTGGNLLQSSDLLKEDSTYYAEIVPTSNCFNLERVAVNVDLSDCDPNKYNFFIPNAFTPNGDGVNDYFFVQNIEKIFPNFTLEIFNRYGALMFKGDKDNFKWDGTVSGDLSANGIYFYVIRYDRDDFEPVQGKLYLQR